MATAKRAPYGDEDFSSLKTDLPTGRGGGEFLEAVEGRERPSQDDILVQYPLQLFLSQVQTLKRLKRERGLVPARLVREFVARGLAEMEGAR